jgi:hypothetical protein
MHALWRTYEFESNAASFYAADCDVEKDTGSLYDLLVNCSVPSFKCST